MILFPNAKINLGLYVTEKRTDGFHNLSTCFYPAPWSDILEITPSSTFEFSTSGLAISGALETNLCYRAFLLLKEAFNIAPVHIHLHKVIPMGAGLGGGSSDAAFTLMGLRDMFKLPLTNEDLIPYAQKLGSDCAFFVYDNACHATGRGEILKPFDCDLSNYLLVLIHPGIHVSTAWAFSQLTPHAKEKSIAKIVAQPIETWKQELINDFENPIINAHPTIGEIKNSLYENGAVYASMSGSGSSVFGIFPKSLHLTKDLFSKQFRVDLV